MLANGQEIKELWHVPTGSLLSGSNKLDVKYFEHISDNVSLETKIVGDTIIASNSGKYYTYNFNNGQLIYTISTSYSLDGNNIGTNIFSDNYDVYNILNGSVVYNSKTASPYGHVVNIDYYDNIFIDDFSNIILVNNGSKRYTYKYNNRLANIHSINGSEIICNTTSDYDYIKYINISNGAVRNLNIDNEDYKIVGGEDRFVYLQAVNSSLFGKYQLSNDNTTLIKIWEIGLPYNARYGNFTISSDYIFICLSSYSSSNRKNYVYNKNNGLEVNTYKIYDDVLSSSRNNNIAFLAFNDIYSNKTLLAKVNDISKIYKEDNTKWQF